MNRLKYNEIFDKVDLYEGLEKDTLTMRLEGNISEDCPSDMHRYDISFPAEVGEYTVDFSPYIPKRRYILKINSVGQNNISITFNGNDYTLHEGMNFLFDIRESQASYDGPWFTGVDEWQAVWVK
jgi:hypothetical protein